jgi:tetratricopeptide (TPR) repeat protein
VDIYREMGDTRRAGQLLARVESMINNTESENAYVALAAYERALLAQGRGDLSGALTSITRALTTVEANPHSSSAPRFLTRRSLILLDMGRLDEARLDADRAVGITRTSKTAGPGTSGLGRAYSALGRVLQAQGKHDEARAALSSALEHLTAAIGAEHPETRQARQLVSLPALHPAVARR